MNSTGARWADDFIILVNSKRAGNRVLKSITRFVENKLKLKVNDQKSRVVPTSKSKFLGFTFRGDKILWHADAEKKFKREIKNLTGRSSGKSMKAVIQELTVYMRGWINYFGIGQGFQKCVDFDSWIRRRLRMCYWKHDCMDGGGRATQEAKAEWRKVRTKVRNLMRLGVSLDMAICCGMSSKSYWHSARTPGINFALSNEHLAEEGYYCLEDRWVEIHYG